MARTRVERETFKKAIEKNGEAMQLVVLFEEMSELQKECCKAFRYSLTKGLKAHIAEEIADVEIMLEQAKMIFNVDEEVEMWRLDKIVRLRERLGILKYHFGDHEEINV